MKDVLLGIAIGDAFGLGLEFQDRKWIQRNIDFSKFVNTREEKFDENYRPGYYSDDTEHSIAVTKALMDKREFSEDLLLEFFKNEYETDRKEKGFSRQGHGSIRDFYDGTCYYLKARKE